MTFECHKLKYFVLEDFNGRLRNVNWDKLNYTSDPYISWSILIGNIRRILDTHFPLKQYNNVPSKAKWITNDLFEMMNHRDEAYTKARCSKETGDWAEAKGLRNLTAEACKNAKRSFIRKYSKIVKTTQNSFGRK